MDIAGPIRSASAAVCDVRDEQPLRDGLDPLPIPWVQPEDVAEPVLDLAADSGRYLTGGTYRVDAGWNSK